MSIGWWPPGIEFDVADLMTVSKVIEDKHRRRK